MEAINKASEVEFKVENKDLQEKLSHEKHRSNSNLETRKQFIPPTKNLNKPDAQKSSETVFTYSNEIENFSKQIIQLKNIIDTDSKASKLIVFSSHLDFLLSSRKNLNINLNVRYYNDADTSNKRYQAANILVSLNSSVETLAYHILNTFQMEDMDISKYLFKVHGLEEYLPYNSNLIELKYFYECINENKEPILILTELKNADTKLAEKSFNQSVKFHPNIQNVNSHQLSKERLDSLLMSIFYNRNLLEASICDDDNFSFERTLNWILNLKEKIASLKMALFDIGHDLTENLLFKLDFYYNKLKQIGNAKILNEKEPLMDYSYKIESTSSSSQFDQLMQLIRQLLNKLNEHLYQFIKCSVLSFYSNIKIDSLPKELSMKNLNLNSNTKEFIEIIQADEKLTIYFKGLSRLDPMLNKIYSSVK